MELVFPWDDRNFDGTSPQKGRVYDSLRKVGFKLNPWRNEPTQQIVGGIGRLMPGILEKKWQLVCSNSVSLLQSLAEIVPIVFSLTTHDSAITVTTEKLVSRFFLDAWGPEDIDRRDDIAWQAKSSGLTCWSDVTQPHSSGSKYHSKFSDLLTKRKALGYPIIFLATLIQARGKSFDEDSADSIFDKVRLALGDTASVLIQEAVSVQYLEVEMKPTDLVNVKL